MQMGKMFITNVHASATYYILDTTYNICIIYNLYSSMCTAKPSIQYRNKNTHKLTKLISCCCHTNHSC